MRADANDLHSTNPSGDACYRSCVGRAGFGALALCDSVSSSKTSSTVVFAKVPFAWGDQYGNGVSAGLASAGSGVRAVFKIIAIIV